MRTSLGCFCREAFLNSVVADVFRVLLPEQANSAGGKLFEQICFRARRIRHNGSDVDVCRRGNGARARQR